MDLIKTLITEWKDRAGEIALVHDHLLVRFIGIGEGAHDVYYICEAITAPMQCTTTWYSAVGNLAPLKGLMRDDDYHRLEGHFSLNQSQPRPFVFIREALEPRHIWTDRNGRELPICAHCSTPWTLRHSRNPDKNTRVDLDTAQPACMCHEHCTTCAHPLQLYAVGELHPHKSGHLCASCDAGPL